MANSQNGIDETSVHVGQMIRMLRERRGLSQQTLAKQSSLSRNTLSLLERGLTSPTVSTLKRIAIALNVDINAFFGSYDDKSVIFTKSNHRPNMRLLHGSLADLAVGKHDQLVTPLVLRLKPGARSGSALTHEGQDFIYCLKGEVLYTVNGTAYVLHPGDSLFFDSELPHRFQSTAAEASELLIILSTPHETSAYIAGHFPPDSIAS
jgi:transcriptional regulator with XRE-family HTH domain